MIEIWMDIQGFPGYKISNTGRIKTICGNIHNGTTHPAGYLVANLYLNGKNHRKYMHRLVAECFIRIGMKHEVVDHIDGNKLNNNQTNLRWLTRTENIYNSDRVNTYKERIAVSNVIHDEIWKSIKEYDGIYEVSNYGRIKRKAKRSFCKEWARTHKPCDTLLSPTIIASYCKVFLSKKNSRKYVAVHRLVAESFIANPNNHPVVNHKDGDKLNNVSTNLEWITQSDNAKHSNQTGLTTILRGSQIGNSKLSEQDIKDIREIWSKGRVSQYKLAELFGMSQCHISDIVNHKRWAHI
jgi:DNA-binding transcriptional regulator YiaG